MKTYYASTFIDQSRTYPDKRGNSKPTGRLSGFLMTRSFYMQGGKRRSSKGIKPFSWSEDTEEAKADALAQAINGMEEMPELDSNPPLDFWPSDKYELV